MSVIIKIPIFDRPSKISESNFSKKKFASFKKPSKLNEGLGWDDINVAASYAEGALEHFIREYNLTQDEAKTLEKMYDKNRAKYLDEIRNLKKEYPGDEINSPAALKKIDALKNKFSSPINKKLKQMLEKQ